MLHENLCPELEFAAEYLAAAFVVVLVAVGTEAEAEQELVHQGCVQLGMPVGSVEELVLLLDLVIYCSLFVLIELDFVGYILLVARIVEFR